MPGPLSRNRIWNSTRPPFSKGGSIHTCTLPPVSACSSAICCTAFSDGGDSGSLIVTTGSGKNPLDDAQVEALAAEAGCEGDIRLRPGQGDLPFVTDQGNLIVDCAFHKISEPEVLAFALKRVPGVVEHGLFLGLADLAIIAGPGGVKAMRRPGA